jgi:hypothetical protein
VPRDPAYRWLRYIGRGGALIQIRVRRPSARARRMRWSWSFVGSSVVFGPFRSKLDTLIDAARACGRSAADMDWQPLDRIEEREARRAA